MTDIEPRTSKGTATRERIVQAALGLFEQLGYDETTMRLVAKEAGVSVGNAYYYFRSKEDLLQAYYGEINAQVATAADGVLAEKRGFRDRLRGTLLAKLGVIEPYHRFSAVLFRTAADPRSPMNPFSEASASMRRQGVDLYREVLSGARIRVPSDLQERLPELLWTYDMGVVLYWIHDGSAGRERTRALIEHSSDLVAKLVRLAGQPLLRPFRRRVVRMLEDLGSAMNGSGAP